MVSEWHTKPNIAENYVDKETIRTTGIQTESQLDKSRSSKSVLKRKQKQTDQHVLNIMSI